MTGAIWKLSSLVTVVAVGGMVVWQARDGLHLNLTGTSAQTQNGDPVLDPNGDPVDDPLLNTTGDGTDPTGARAAAANSLTAEDNDSFTAGTTGARTASRTGARTAPRGAAGEFAEQDIGFENTEPAVATVEGDPFNNDAAAFQPASGNATADEFAEQEPGRRTAGGPGSAANALADNDNIAANRRTAPRTENRTTENRTNGGILASDDIQVTERQLEDPTLTQMDEFDARAASRTAPRAPRSGIAGSALADESDTTAFGNGARLRTGSPTGARTAPRGRTALSANDPFSTGTEVIDVSPNDVVEDTQFETTPRTSGRGASRSNALMDDMEFGNRARPNRLLVDDSGTTGPDLAQDTNSIEPTETVFDEQNTAPRAGSPGRPSLSAFDDEDNAPRTQPQRRTPSPVPAEMIETPFNDYHENGGNNGRPVIVDDVQSATSGSGTQIDVLNVPRTQPRPAAPPKAPTRNSRTSNGRGKVTIEKLAPQQAFLGQPLVYHITIRNVGTGSAQQVTVEDPVPNTMDIVGSIPQAEMQGRKLLWKIGTMAAGVERKISVKVIPRAEGPVGSAATVNYVADPGLDTEVLTDGRVTLDLQGPTEVQVGERFSMTFRVTNHTDQDTSSLSIRDLLPAGLKHEGGSDLEYAVGTLKPGESKEVTLDLEAAEAGTAVSRAVVLASNEVLQNSEYRIDVLNGSGSRVSADQGADLSLTRQGPKRVLLQRPTQFSNRLRNRSSLRLVNLTVVEEVPEGVDIIQALDSGTFDPIKRRVIWQIDQLEPQSTVELRVVASVNSESALSAQVSVTDAAGNQVRTQSEVTATGAPQLSLEVVPLNGPVPLGELLEYEVTLKNRGTALARSVNLQIELPAGLQLEEAGPWPAKVVGRVVEFEMLNELGPGKLEQAVLKFRTQRAGESHLQFKYSAEHMTKPLGREESVLVVGEER